MTVCIMLKDDKYLEADIKGIKFDFENGTIEIIDIDYDFVKFNIKNDDIVSVHVVNQLIPDRKVRTA